MDPRQVQMYAHSRRRREKEEAERKQKALQEGAKFKADYRGLGVSAITTSLLLLFLGVILALPTLGVSFMLALIAIPFVFIYYYGIKRPIRNKKAKNVPYRCVYCNTTFMGPQKACPSCGHQLNCDVNEYKCENCGHKFIAQRDTCPQCGVGLYYK